LQHITVFQPDQFNFVSSIVRDSNHMPICTNTCIQVITVRLIYYCCGSLSRSYIVTGTLLVVLQAVKVKIHFGVLLLSALLHCPRINHDMLWCKFLSYINLHPPDISNSCKLGGYFHIFPCHNIFSCLSRVLVIHWILWFAVL